MLAKAKGQKPFAKEKHMVFQKETMHFG